jgi:quinol monooxygenase YgiN
MSLPVLTGFAGVLVAAVATGVLAGRCVRRPRMDFILWTAATLLLAAALAAESLGFYSGFGATTFRIVQLLALLLVPLWLAWGLVEAVAGSDAVRFGMRLVSSALTVVAAVILTTDPLTAQPFSKSFPQAGPYFQPVSHDAIDVVQVVAVIAVVVSAGLASARAGRRGQDPRWRSALTGIAAVGLAVLLTAGQRFSWPDTFVYPLLGLVAAALVWFGATRIATRIQPLAPPLAARGGAGGGLLGGPDDDLWAADGYPAGNDGQPEYATYGYRGTSGPHRAPNATDQVRRARTGTPPPARERPDGYRGPGPLPSVSPLPPVSPFPPVGHSGRFDPADPADLGGPADPAGLAGQATAMTGADPQFGTLATAAGSPATGGAATAAGTATGGAATAATGAGAAPARPYGRILIFTLLDDRVADFDRLAEQAAEEVRTREPGTLVYVIHLVPNAPMQRIFYEIYRDGDAFDSHERQPYMQRFVVDRRSCVLATNVIELRLKYAKVAPLPNQEPAGTTLPPGPRMPLAPGAPPGRTGPQPGPAPGPATGPQPAQRLEPLPAGPPHGTRRPGARPYGGT